MTTWTLLLVFSLGGDGGVAIERFEGYASQAACFEAVKNGQGGRHWAKHLRLTTYCVPGPKEK